MDTRMRSLILSAALVVAPCLAMAQSTGGNSTVIGSIATSGDTTITTANTAQTLFAGAVPINGFEICNPDATSDLWISDSTTAAINGVGSFRLPPGGGYYATPLGRKPIAAVSVISAVAGTKITSRRW